MMKKHREKCWRARKNRDGSNVGEYWQARLLAGTNTGRYENRCPFHLVQELLHSMLPVSAPDGWHSQFAGASSTSQSKQVFPLVVMQEI
jgi:hypothetical protein